MRPNLPSDIAVLLARRWAGEPSVGDDLVDDLRLDAWLADSANAERAERLRSALPVEGVFAYNGDSAAFTRRVLEAVHANATRTAPLARRNIADSMERFRGGRPARLGWTGAAIGIAAVAIAAIAFPIVRHRAGLTATQQNARTYVTAAGQQATVTLANGARAILGPATTLSVATNANDASTTATVSGQALFTVVHHSQHPFTVRAGNTVTRVLGTTFLVRHYPTDPVARVVVADGRVSLRGLGRAPTSGGIGTVSDVVLSARAVGVVDDSGYVRVTPNVVVEDYTAWTKGQLVFRKTPARDVVLELRRAYGADIRLEDSTLAAQTLTWTVVVTEKSLASVLHALATALGGHVTRSGDVITIAPGPSQLLRHAVPRVSNPLESQYGR